MMPDKEDDYDYETPLYKGVVDTHGALRKVIGLARTSCPICGRLTSSPCDFGLTQSITNQTMLSFTQNAVVIGRSNNLHSSQSSESKNDSFNKVGSLASKYERYWSPPIKPIDESLWYEGSWRTIFDIPIRFKGEDGFHVDIPIHHLGSLTCW